SPHIILLRPPVPTLLPYTTLFRSGEGTDRLLAIENATGSPFNDVLVGNNLANLLVGGAGLDRINGEAGEDTLDGGDGEDVLQGGDRKSTRLNSSHQIISYAVFCLK